MGVAPHPRIRSPGDVITAGSFGGCQVRADMEIEGIDWGLVPFSKPSAPVWAARQYL